MGKRARGSTGVCEACLSNNRLGSACTAGSQGFPPHAGPEFRILLELLSQAAPHVEAVKTYEFVKTSCFVGESTNRAMVRRASKIRRTEES